MKAKDQSPIRVMRIIARMNVGGPAVQISGLMRGFNREEFEQQLYTGYCADGEADYLDSIATDLKAVRIKGFGRHISILEDFSAFVALVIEIRKFKPHIIHTHTAKAGFLGRIASIVSLHPSIRIHTFHGHLLNGYFGRFKRLLIVLAEKSLAIFTIQLLAVGDRVREDLLQAGIGTRASFALMPPGLSISALPEKNASRGSLGLPIGRLQCAFIGRVTQIKRPDRFLDVVSEIKKRGIPLDFFIAGDGELLDLCRERISKENLSVAILGWQNDIEKVLSAADIVILTSDNEGTPLSLIQAGMAKLPVVSTAVGSVSEIVLNGVTGILTSLSTQSIADALEKLVIDRDLRVELGMAAQDFTLAHFGVERLVRDHEKLYKKLISSLAKS
jgi:glycosyltransferase involved in cell wall biosynthesis